MAHTPESRRAFGQADWLKPAVDVGRYRVYENTLTTKAFLVGNGTVKADYGRLRIEGASEGNLVIKYHWSPLLATTPPQQVAAYAVGQDPVSFIRIPNNKVSEFVISDAPLRSPSR